MCDVILRKKKHVTRKAWVTARVFATTWPW